MRDNTHIAKRKSEKRWRPAGWPTYKAAYAAFRAIVQGAVDAGLQPGHPLPACYDEFLNWLVAGHPQAGEKIGPGVRYFTICVVNRRRKGYGRFGFAIVDNRGEVRAIELSTALRGFNNTKRFDVVSAFRYAIRDQVLVVRRQALGQRCPETGEVLTADNCEVDHCEAAFEHLLWNFLCGWRDTSIENVETVLTTQGAVHQHVLADRELAVAWCAFHQRFAQLQALSREGHRRRTVARRNPLHGLST